LLVFILDATELPELLPFGYLVGDVTSIMVGLKGKRLCVSKHIDLR